MEILVFQCLRKIVPSLEVSPMIPYSMHIASVYLPCGIWILLSPSTYFMALEDPEISKQGTAGKRKHVTLTVPQKLEIIRKLESGRLKSVVMSSCNIGSTVYDMTKQRTNYDHLQHQMEV
jgi:hypothetical protein